MANSKIVLSDGTVLIDLTGDTIVPAALLSTYTAHNKAGEPITGECTYDVDSSGATAGVAEVLATKTFGAQGTMKTGTMPNIGKQTGTISTKSGSVAISHGYHDGSGSVSISSTEQAKLIAANIKAGVEILGVPGSYSGEAVSAQSKTVTPNFTQQTILPDEGTDYLSQVTVSAIPVVYTDNAAGGKTVTIG